MTVEISARRRRRHRFADVAARLRAARPQGRRQRSTSHAPRGTWRATIKRSTSTTPRPLRSGDPCNTGSVAARPKQRNLGRLSEIAQVAVRHGFGYAIEGRRGRDRDERHRPRHATSARCSTSSARRSSSSASCSRRGRTSFRRTSSPSCGACRTTCARFRSRRSSARSRRSSASRSSGCSPSSRRPRSPRRRSGRCTARTLPNGRRVVVKVQRPNAPRQIEADLSLMYQAARLAKERIRALDFIDTNEIVDEFARSIRQELDYRLEGRNADAFHKTSPVIRTWPCRASTGRTRARACSRSSGSKGCSSPISTWTSGRSTSVGGSPT